MTMVVLAGIALLITHLGISGTSIRGVLVARLGEGPYMGLYSLLTAVTMGGLIWAYLQAPRFDYFWWPSSAAFWVPKILMWPAAVLLLGGFMVRNPTMVGQGEMVNDPQARAAAATGVNRITRHPFQWSVILWACSHLVANGDTVSVAFFATFLFLSLLGSYSLDAKKARQLGDGWQEYAKLTSNLPFAAILRGDQRLVIKELLVPGLVGTAGYLAMYFGHPWLAGIGVY